MAKTGVQLNGGEEVQGVLPVGYGGTGLSTPGSSGNVLTSNGTGFVSSPPATQPGVEVVSVSSSTTVTMTTSASCYVGTGTTATYTLPTVASGPTGYRITLDNRGSGAITLNPAGTDKVYHHGSAITNVSIPPGDSLVLVNDGTYWNSVAWVDLVERIATATGATPAINVDNTDQANVTCTANITSMTSGLTGTPLDGQKLMLRFYGTAAYTITWGASYASTGVATLLATTVANKYHYVGLIYNLAATTWDCVAVDATGR